MSAGDDTTGACAQPQSRLIEREIVMRVESIAHSDTCNMLKLIFFSIYLKPLEYYCHLKLFRRKMLHLFVIEMINHDTQ